MKTIRWGMIGCGNVTEKKSGPAFYKATNSELVAVTNRTLEKAESYAKRHNVAKVYNTAGELIRDKEIDAVYIATPPSSHKEYAIACANAGKVAYIEKPMALDYLECLEIIAAFKENKVKGYVAYYKRLLDRFVKVKSLIESGAIGQVRFVNSMLYRSAAESEKNGCWRVDKSIAGGGIFMDLAVHALDMFDYYFGEIVDVWGTASNQAGLYEPEDIVCCSFKFKSGVLGTATWCFTTHESIDNILIMGSEGSINFSCFSNNPIILANEKGTENVDYEKPEHVQQALIQSIVDELNGVGNCPSTLASGARTAWVCDQILKRK